jgi:hypothetical protein
MTTALEGCCARRAPRPRPSRLSWSALVSGVALAFLPKCPLCLAAYLTVLGLGTGVAAPLARLLHPLTALVAVAVLALFVLRLARRAHRFSQARITG